MSLGPALSLTDVCWHGTRKEGMRLHAAIHAHRECADDDLCCDDAGEPLDGYCAAHSLMLSQRILDGLVFARRIAWKLRAEEFSVTAPAILAVCELVRQALNREV